MSYHDFWQHELMLKDVVRTRAFERAIREVIRPGMTVLDFGCGTGILSFFAERAGAEKVFAVDRTDMVFAAEAIARHNGFRRITFLHSSGDGLELSEKVDLIVSEWMGSFVLREHMLSPLLRVRDAHLKAAGTMLPMSVRWRGALVVDPSFYREKAFFDTRPYDVDFSPVRDWAFAQVATRSLPPAQLSSAFDLGSLDVLAANEEPTMIEGSTTLESDAVVYGFCGWFEAALTPNVILDTGPGAPPTHWRQLVFPFPRPIAVAGHEPLQICIRPVHLDPKETHWHWSLKTPRDGVEWDDFSYRAHLLRKSRRT